MLKWALPWGTQEWLFLDTLQKCVFLGVLGIWLGSRTLHMEAWPGSQCKGLVTETALGHGVPRVISLFWLLLSALCAQPTALQGESWGKAATAAWLKHEFSLPKGSDRGTSSAGMALLVRFHSPMHKTAHSYQSKRFHSHFTWNVKEKGEGITTKIYYYFF